MAKELPADHPESAHKDKMGKVMHEWKRGTLHSGTGKKGKKGPVVKSQAQAIAIGISESKHSEWLQAMGFSEEAALAFTEMMAFVESKKAAEQAEMGPLSDVDATPGKQKGDSGRRKQPQQGSLSTFPTIPH